MDILWGLPPVLRTVLEHQTLELASSGVPKDHACSDQIRCWQKTISKEGWRKIQELDRELLAARPEDLPPIARKVVANVRPMDPEQEIEAIWSNTASSLPRNREASEKKAALQLAKQEAAVKIQAIYRGRMAREQVKNMDPRPACSSESKAQEATAAASEAQNAADKAAAAEYPAEDAATAVPEEVMTTVHHEHVEHVEQTVEVPIPRATQQSQEQFLLFEPLSVLAEGSAVAPAEMQEASFFDLLRDLCLCCGSRKSSFTEKRRTK